MLIGMFSVGPAQPILVPEVTCVCVFFFAARAAQAPQGAWNFEGLSAHLSSVYAARRFDRRPTRAGVPAEPAMGPFLLCVSRVAGLGRRDPRCTGGVVGGLWIPVTCVFIVFPRLRCLSVSEMSVLERRISNVQCTRSISPL